MPTAADPTDTAKSAQQPLILQTRAIETGLWDGELALERARVFMVLQLFVRSRVGPLPDPKLEALRAYAEMTRVLWAQGRRLSSEPLQRIGLAPVEIKAVERIITNRLAPLHDK